MSQNANLCQHGHQNAARGFMNPNTGEIGAQYDNALVEQEDIVKHEVMERKLAYGEVNADDVIELAARYVDMAKIEAMINFYDRYIPSENKEHARSEVVCDGADHINQVRHLGTAYAELADTFDEVLNALNRAANELTDGAFELEGEAAGQVPVKKNGGDAESATRFSMQLPVESRNSYDGISLAEDSKAYSYDFMTAQPDMTVAEMPTLASVKDGDSISRGKAVSLGLENAEALGHKVSDSVVAVKNDYTNRDIRIGRSALEHGLYGDNVSRLRTNARLAAIAGDIVKNAIPVNALTNKKAQASGTYAMAALLQSGDRHVVAIVTVEQYKNSVDNIDYIDVTHAISGRLEKENSRRSSTRETGFLMPSTSAARISIADFLEIVNATHRSILSDDVLQHFGEIRPEDGYYTGRVKFSQQLPGLDEPSAENEALRNEVEYWKGQTKLTNPEERTVRRGDIDKLAKRLIKSYGSTLKAEDISGELAELGDYIVRNGVGETSD